MSRSRNRLLAALTGTALALVTLAGPVAPAAADTVPIDPALPLTVASDPLPTVQINGVVWNQQVVGGRVYVGGSFTSARPAGSPAGTNEVPRYNLLAYDLATGVLVPGFAPNVNAQVKDLSVSPDQRTLYVAGQFTTIDGQTRNRVAAFDAATGALLGSFQPNVNGPLYAIAASANAVYLGGTMSAVNGVGRSRIAAVNPATGATLPFNASIADGRVQALAVAPDGGSVVAGGNFTSVSGSSNPGYGLARLNGATGALLPLPVNTQARDAGANAAILSLETDGTNFYGSGYVFGAGGNIEGSFAADWPTGSLVWVEDCHGDTYSAYPAGAAVYSASHKHYCGNNGGFPQTTPWTFHRGTATTKVATRVNTADYNGYVDHRGQPSPTILTWFPDINIGTYTGKSQGPWTVTAAGQYVLYGGEFTRVEGRDQQGLVRFAMPSIAPNKRGPAPSGSGYPLVATSDAAGAVRLTWRSSADPDNETLTYSLYRGSTNNPPISQTTMTTTFWRTQALTFQDTGLVGGSTQQYQVVVTDPFGNRATSPWTSVVVRSSGPVSTYARTVLDDGPAAFWRLGEPSGTTIADTTGFYGATAASDLTRGVTGAVAGDPSTATTFPGTTSGYAASVVVGNAPEAVSVEAWIRTTTTRGGKIVGFGNRASGTSDIGDRHLYMDGSGRLSFGIQSSILQTVRSAASYNNGAWHHVVGTYAAGTMRLYVDGALVSERSDVTHMRAYWGYWRLGGDRLDGWPNRPASDYFAGTIDEVAVYNRVLPAAAIAAHYAAGTGGTVPNEAPVASFTASASGLGVSVDGSASSDQDGTITGYAWTFGDGANASGPTASHTYAAAGTYSVQLTVTDNDGATGTTTQSVTVTAPAGGAFAQDSFSRSVTSGWGTSEVGGAWTTTGSAAQVQVDGQRGLHTMLAGALLESALTAVQSTSTDAQVTVTADKVPAGSGAFVTLDGRRITGTNYYGARLRLQADGSVLLHVTRGNGTPVDGGTVPGLTFVAGDQLRVRVQVDGTNPTTVRAKVWEVGQAEPATWFASMTDTTSSLQAPGSVGVATYLFGSAVNAPVAFGYDDLQAGPLG